ncbi:MAG: DUF433 domain-containing protein [Solirubrobacteraceae bacterium]|jgi:uncharacterized protein (DUF433 family)
MDGVDDLSRVDSLEADRCDPEDGVPCIRGLRIPVATVVGMIADEILNAYPDLELGDVQEALPLRGRGRP